MEIEKLLPVIQADRDAAADYASEHWLWPAPSVADLRRGGENWDEYHLTQAFARHREATTQAPADLRSALEAETTGLVEMLKAAQYWDDVAVFEHSPEEIGLEVMDHHRAILAALAPTKGDVS